MTGSLQYDNREDAIAATSLSARTEPLLEGNWEKLHLLCNNASMINDDELEGTSENQA
eukprot:CAMPEP_0203965108 /NCGR_PEP_ID=MMETSP0359-20131031/94688_1 /ASSEMBLY_ACC=CAM_ASM_000338 /TAXON_ID=268821 /ORGANISM="Scrippsiella Hangoei, Strain SHTV-5" /LENGTH=57 /DNA_ID=CAMNT_0050901853 /DNA_START=96 /DNA_END=266 /DNA_ORIENTATION=+